MMATDSCEQFCPTFHAFPAEGWMNDPNGLILHKGEYHLFFQHHPHSTVWGPMHWGHLISRDLYHWEELEISLQPDRNGMIFSGCVVFDQANTSGLVPGGGLVAIYTCHLLDDLWRQQEAQGIAFSLDQGRSWTPYVGNPVLMATSAKEAVDFRDPRVFWHEDHWVLLLVAGDHLQFFRSDTLRKWDHVGVFRFPLSGGIWECPDLFPLKLDGEGRELWILVLSIIEGAPAGGFGTLYFVGTFDGAAFSPIGVPRWLDYGPDNYAASTWETETGRIQIGWMNNWHYAREIPPAAGRSRGSMTLPRRLNLVDMPNQGLLIQQSPVTPSCRRSTVKRSIRLDAEQIGQLGTVSCRSYQKISIERMGADPGDFQGLFRWQFACGAVLELTWNSKDNAFSVDRSRCGQIAFHDSFAGRFEVPVNQQSERFEAVIIFDNTSMEVFAQNGTTVASFLIFPEKTDGDITLECQSGTAGIIVSATWWEIAL